MELREKQEETGLRGANPSVRDLAAGGALLWKTAKGAGYAAKGGAHIAAFAARKGKSLAQTASLDRESRAALATLTREQKKQWDSYTPRQQRQILEKVSRKIERRMAYTASDAKAGTGTEETSERFARHTGNRVGHRTEPPGGTTGNRSGVFLFQQKRRPVQNRGFYPEVRIFFCSGGRL